MRVILDTNVIIAAFATQGLCHLVFENAIAHHELIQCPFLLEEIQNNLKHKLKLTSGKVKEILAFLKEHSTSCEDLEVQGLHCRDPKDVKVLALAVNSKAEALVTGDQDLLVLKSAANTPILSPREFWNILRTLQT